MLEFHITRAVLDLQDFSCEVFRQIHAGCYVIVCCRCVKYVALRDGTNLVTNCLVRIQSTCPLSAEDKEDYLRYISRRILWVSPEMRCELSEWMARWKKTDFVFTETGLRIHTQTCVKFALKTMSFEVSNTVIPACVPYMHAPVTFLECCKVNVRVAVVMPPYRRGSPICQPVFTRSMLVDFVPPEHRELIFRGVCYIPAYRRTMYLDLEEWVLHVHGPYCCCPSGCERCDMRQPIRLFYLAQLACLRLAMLRRRARVTHRRKSRFFK